LNEPDPFDVLILDERRDADGDLVRVDGLITLLSSSKVVFFSDDRGRADAAQMQTNGVLDIGELTGGVRSAVLRPEVAGTAPVVVAATELSQDAGFAGAELLTFQPTTNSSILRFDVSAETGALGMRDIVLVPGEDGAADALIAVLRFPDALARFEIDDDGTIPSLRLSGLASTCKAPTNLAYAPLVGAGGLDADRVLLTCQDENVIQAIDPWTLLPTDALRFDGRAPYDVVVNLAADPVEAYVSFFLDDSVGVLRFDDVGGARKLVFAGRIGRQTEEPEDGRE
jgi:hypothetical protein